MNTYAIIQSGGKQYRVHSGDTVRVESLPYGEGDTINMEDVLLVSKDGSVTVGTPNVSGANVTAEVVGNGKHEKIVVFKYKSKTRYRRKNGHRQTYTDLKITNITI